MAAVCFTFADKKECRFGATCRFSHDATVIAEESANRRVCKFFTNTGNCKFGTQCRHLHTTPAEPRGAKRAERDTTNATVAITSPPRKQRKLALIHTIQESIDVQHTLPPPRRGPERTTAERKHPPRGSHAKLPALVFTGALQYARTTEQCEELARHMTHEALAEGSSRVVGMDCEWRPQFIKNLPENKVALLQVALSDKCYLFHIHYCGISPALRDFLGSKQVMKIGIGLPADVNRLVAQYDVPTRNVVDLDLYAKQVGLVHPKKGSWGVKSLAELLLGQTVDKPKSVQMSNWEAELTSAQRLYAALDAWSCIKMYQALNATHLLAPLIARVQAERQAWDEQVEALREKKMLTREKRLAEGEEKYAN